MRFALTMSSRVTLPFPTRIVWDSASPEDSWDILEQSGRLFVPYARANSWYPPPPYCTGRTLERGFVMGFQPVQLWAMS